MLDIDDLISKQISHWFNGASSNKKKKKSWNQSLMHQWQWRWQGLRLNYPQFLQRWKVLPASLRITNAGEPFKIEGLLLLQQLSWRHISFTTSSIERTQYKLIKPRLPRLVLHEGLADVYFGVTLSCNKCGWYLWTIIWTYRGEVRSRNFVNSKALRWGYRSSGPLIAFH